MKRHCLLIGIMAMIAASCDICEMGRTAKEGSLTLSVDMEQVATKAAMSEEQLLADASVKIYYADFSGLVRSYRYADTPASILLPANTYRVDVLAGEAAKDNPAKASWEQKSYKGSKDFTITAGANTEVQVQANVCNAISKLTFDQSVADNFATGYSVNVSVDDQTSLTYDASRSGSEGYFIISGMDEPAFTWTFTGRLKDGGEFTKNGRISGIEAGKLYALKLKYTVKDGIGTFDLLVDYDTEDIEDIIIFEPVSTGLSASSKYEIWAKHADVHADVDEGEVSDLSTIKFAYSADGSTWTMVDAVRSSEGVFDARLTGLEPETTYSYKLVIAGEDVGEPMTFTTEAAQKIPNGSFEETSQSKSKNFMEFYNPASEYPECRTPWWGSGNGSDGIDGSADFGGFVICKSDTEDAVDGSKSVCMTSMYALVKFAAGNLFTGYFGGLVGTKGGIVYFGRPFTSRPTALRLKLKYSTGKINRIDSYPADDPVTTNDYDRARIQFALGTWNYRTYGGTKDCPVKVNTTEPSTFVDYNKDASTIAYGEIILQGDAENSHNTWKEVTIPLNYKNLNEYPTHIIISCAASMLGDYFSGCDTSKFWVDAMELVYE